MKKRKKVFNTEKSSFEKNLKKEVRKAEEELEKEVFLNVPNTITLLRVVFGFVFIYMLFSGFPMISLIIIYAIAALTDWFDGFFARKLNQKTKIGAKMDQFIDRIFYIGLAIAILIHSHINNNLSNTILLMFLISSREILGSFGLIIVLIRRKPWYQVKFIGKLTTFVQAFALGAIILGVDWAIYLAIPTCILGIISGLDYIRYSLE